MRTSCFSPAVIGLLVSLLLVASTGRAEFAFDVLPNQEYAQRDTGSLLADVYMPQGEGPFPAMIIIHGGAWAAGNKEQLSGVAKAFAKLGYTAVAISYRLAPESKFPAQIYDCQAAVRWLRTNAARYKVDPARIGGFGYSAGGQLVALLGALDDRDEVREPGLPDNAPSARLQVVVAGGAPCEFRNLPVDSQRLAFWLGGTPAEKPDFYREASPAAYITSDDPPMFFFNGASDRLVPSRSAKAVVAKLKDAGVPAEFHEVPDADHLGAATDRPTILQAMAFVDRYMGAKKSDTQGDHPPQAPSKGDSAYGQ
jgi:acetyl esterase/lipase